jgi:hypothetical protein
MGVQFAEEGVAIDFLVKTDVRKGGALQLTKTLFVGYDRDYRDGIDDLMDKAEEVLRDALEDFPTAPVLESDSPDEDDEKGMGWGDDS